MSRKRYTPEQIIGMLREAKSAWHRAIRLARYVVSWEFPSRVTIAGAVNTVA